MSAFFGFAGIVGMIIGSIFIFKKKKKAQPIIVPAISTLIAAALFVIGLALPSGGENNSDMALAMLTTTVNTEAFTQAKSSTIAVITTMEAARTQADTTTKPFTTTSATTTTKAPVTTKQAAKAAQNTGRAVYITPTGKRYHYNGSCNGGKYIKSNLDEAKSKGLTPCNKCVG